MLLLALQLQQVQAVLLVNTAQKPLMTIPFLAIQEPLTPVQVAQIKILALIAQLENNVPKDQLPQTLIAVLAHTVL